MLLGADLTEVIEFFTDTGRSDFLRIETKMLHVIDNFIKDETLLSLIRTDDKFFPSVMDGEDIGQTNNYYHDGSASCFAPYMFWPGWKNKPANTLRKKVIETVFKDTNFIPFPIEEVAGFEYWCRTFGPGQYLKAHVDEDTFAYEEDKRFNAPALGCVWYGFSEANGGFLELHDSVIAGNPENVLEAENFSKYVSPSERLERVAYKPNRLVVFEAGRRVHNTTRTLSGKRQVMVINVWRVDSQPSGLGKNRFFYE